MSDTFQVRKSRLVGTVTLSGAKNSALKLLAASILTSGKIELHNFPSSLTDAVIHIEMLRLLGKTVTINGDSAVIEEDGSLTSRLDWDGRSIRNTLLILGALTARTGFAAVPLPGGCNLGERKYDLHELVLTSLGARVWLEEGMLCCEAPTGLKANDIHLPIRSTGATENAIISATLAQGTTRLWNPHIRPEIIDLIRFLRQIGAKIRVFGQERIEITGTDGLSSATYTIMPDNMEAITWLVASVMTKGDIEILDFPLRDLEVPLIHLRESGAIFYRGDHSLLVRGGTCYPIDISTGPFPGINSDVQPILAAYAACAYGESHLIDLRFPGRYGYAKEMSKMGLVYQIMDNLISINGNGGILAGCEVNALDLRAGAALLLCGLIAEDATTISNAWQIERGYNDIVSKLQALSGNIAAY
jgi:UDP-N-acetylglucosamine 1-carboxyvinyltransferase